MTMEKKVKKDFNYVWDLIELSVFIIVGYNLLELIFSINSYIDKIFPSAIFSIALTIFAFGLIGYKAVHKKKNLNELQDMVLMQD